MPTPISEASFHQLKQSLPAAFRESLKNDEVVLIKAYPLLNMICKNRDLISELQKNLNIPSPPSNQELTSQLSTICNELEYEFDFEGRFPYRLPTVLSEFPIHSRPINKSIHAFNTIVETYHHANKEKSPGGKASLILSDYSLEDCYKGVLRTIREHGPYCDHESLWQLLEMIVGWSTLSFTKVFKSDAHSKVEAPLSITQYIIDDSPVSITESEQSVLSSIQPPFIPEYTYNYNSAGRLDSETDILLLNAFGMKIGGHFDAQVKYPPRFIPLEQLHALIRRQLSHRMEVPVTGHFQLWLEATLYQLGVEFIQRNEGYQSKDLLVNPFLSEPISFLSPEKIHSVLKEILVEFDFEELAPDKATLDILSQYLFELLQGFQTNAGQALGIGANWDGTVNLSNEAGAYAFKFREGEALWGKRFKQLSLHRQGPSEARMNAAIGIKFEIQSLLANFDYMSQLQPSEYGEVIYNALVDNLVSELLPEPSYFENTAYKKFRKQYVAYPTDEGLIQIQSFYLPSSHGTYFKDREGNEKQTPMYRRAGTLDVLAFPKNTTYSEQSRVCYEGNPLGPLQLQYAQAMHRSTRGHIVYDPIAPDQFMEDPFYGQVIRADNGDYLPFIGVIPKNFDRYFNQDNELCASFVVRMLQSSRIIEYCPTFAAAYRQIKTRFLPNIEALPPTLPQFCTNYLREKHAKLVAGLASQKRTFEDCEHKFYSLFKNLVYNLYEFGRQDEHFKHSFLAFINSSEAFYPVSKAKCEKLIRDLSVSRPVFVTEDSQAHYDEILIYLKDLTAYFYPKPSDSLAQEIARQAKLHVGSLLKSPSVKAYFEKQKQNKQTNLSRKQTPGMLYAALKHDGPSKTVIDDYRRMHRYNFLSYYRDPDGTPLGGPQTYDFILDWGAKSLGAALQLMHKYQPLALIHYPLTEPYLRTKQRIAAHQNDNLKFLQAIRGGVEGLIWHGIIKGLWYTTATPFLMLGDFVSWQFQFLKDKKNTQLDNPLVLPAAPANVPSVKSLAAADSRDFLLQLLDHSNVSNIKESIITYAVKVAKNLYPHFTEEQNTLCYQKLKTSFPFGEEECKSLFQPLLLSKEYVKLSALFQKFNAHINKNLIEAVFRCLTEPLFSQFAKEIIKDTQSFFALNSKQNKILECILELYKKTPQNKKAKFLQLFRFGGELQHSLRVRDQLIQKAQGFILKVFDEQWILEYLFESSIDRLSSNLSALTLTNTISQLPNTMKGPLQKLLSSGNPQSLNEYCLTEKQVIVLLKINEIYQQISAQEKTYIFNQCETKKQSNEKTLSLKDKAHHKWTKFAIRELRHQLLSQEDANQLCEILTNKLTALGPAIERVRSAYYDLNMGKENALQSFYKACNDLNNSLDLLLRLKSNAKSCYSEVQSLLNNFLNITLNAVINSAMDKVDLFNMEPQNPLLNIDVIELWLVKLAKNNCDLRSILEQQVHQSPSLDHAVWRCKCILQVLEKQNPEQKVSKTGMQSLLRFWVQHKENVTMTGEKYSNPETGEPDKATVTVLLKDSKTMQHAMTRVQNKLPKFSIFRIPQKAEEIDLEQTPTKIIPL
ncbi:hypothetical protein EP47_04360 [Legionella norrlandica]|uniref:Uncharacterized protein n=1 Tax=Legionella norrlandica TaxID=1498499 RepID=A0A0A2STB6_9GAMM|nr:hypothetical protein [Legionella norrlandica]KGP62709.1 hypothetical protein EP47_04360 [Legionella norrlandica]